MVLAGLNHRDLVLVLVIGAEGFGSPMGLVDQTPLFSLALKLLKTSSHINFLKPSNTIQGTDWYLSLIAFT